VSATTSGRADWTNQTLSDWLDMTPSDWMDQTMPGWRDWSYGRLLQARPSEWWGMMTGQPGGPAAPPPTRPGMRPRHHGHRYRHHWDCGCHEHREHWHRHNECGHCGHDPCECFCCIGDVDLAVYTRVAEERVIPVMIENERRREQEVTLDLSDWTTRGAKAASVETLLLEPKSFTLAPCGEQSVVLVVRINPDPASGDEADSPKAAGKEASAPARRDHLGDVGGCETVTADLRLVGCDHRPIRIAVAILPRDCDPLRVPCGCACC
jgi:hypothetical protein